jgi:hypothetical protein
MQRTAASANGNDAVGTLRQENTASKELGETLGVFAWLTGLEMISISLVDPLIFG